MCQGGYMQRRSVGNQLRRKPSRQGRCALVALALSLLVFALPANGDPPVLPSPAESGAGSPAEVGSDAPPVVEKAPELPPPPAAAAVRETSAPSEDLAVALERRGDLNLHGL